MFERPNIILIVMDTVRADHLSCYGYPRKTTPNIDKIAQEGLLFKNAFSAAPWTPPSHASIFTGRYPSHHKTLGKNIYFEKIEHSLPRILSFHGYETFGVTCCSLLGEGSGFDTCFNKYYDISKHSNFFSCLTRTQLKNLLNASLNGPDKGAFEANSLVESKLFTQMLDKKYGKKPFFLFINYFECHTPYDPPWPYKEIFCKDFRESRIYLKDFILQNTIKKTSEAFTDSNLDIQKLQWIAGGEGGFAFATGKLAVSKKEWDIIKSWYDGELKYLDHQIGKLIESLLLHDIFENTLLIITSDHGENFGDHGLAIHPLCLYDSLLRVPLIIRIPSSIPEGKAYENLVSTVDIFPTILDQVRIHYNNFEIDGKSLYPLTDEKIHDFVCAEYGGLHRRAMQEPSTRELDSIDKRGKCIRGSQFKYIVSLNTEELYNIRDDPSEEENILSEHRDIAKLLRKQLAATIDISYFGPQDFPHKKGSEEMLDRLKALGYV